MIWGRYRRASPLAKRFVAAIRDIDPAVDISFVSASTVTIAIPGGAKVQCSLDSLREELRHRADTDGLVEHYARSMIASAQPMSDVVDVSQVLPLLKPLGWAEAAAPPGQNPLAVRLTDSVEMVFVEQRSEQLRFVAERHLEPSQLDLTSMRENSLENLSALEFSIHRMPDGPFWIAMATGQFSFNATLALRSDVWEQASRFAGANVVCAIPERESCLFAADNDAAAIAELREVLGPRLHAAAGYPVTTVLLHFDGGHLVECLH